MLLLVNELKNELSQVVVAGKNETIRSIRAYIYKHNFPSGQFHIEIQSMLGDTIAISESHSSTDISDANFFHGFIRFNIYASLQKNINYKIVLKSTGYAFSESSYLGWCNSFEHSSYEPEYEVIGSNYCPLRLEIWALEHI